MDFVTVSTGLILPYWMGLPIRYIHFDIEVDGNINDQTIIPCYTSGANIFVSGGYIFGHDNPEQRIKKLKNVLCNSRIS